MPRDICFFLSQRVDFNIHLVVYDYIVEKHTTLELCVSAGKAMCLLEMKQPLFDVSLPQIIP